MEELQRLVRAVNLYTPNQSLLLNLNDASTLEGLLFDLLKEERVFQDEEIAEALYGERVLSNSYRMLKSRFRKKLFNHLHFLQFNEGKFNAYSVASQQCMAMVQEGHCLLILSENRLADKVFDQLVALAEKYEIYDYLVKALELKQVIASNQGNVQKYKKQEKLLQNAIEKRDIERKALSIYQNIMVQQKQSVQQRNDVLSHFDAAIAALRTMWEETGISSIYNYYHIIRVQHLELLGDYEGVSVAIEESEALFEIGKINEVWYKKKFNIFVMMYALLQTRKYKAGKEFAFKNLTNFNPYSANWFAFIENYLLVALHDQDYALAIKLLDDCFTGNHFVKISEFIQERLEVVRRYVMFLSKNRGISEGISLNKSFKEHLIILPKDKSGFNLALLVLDVLHKLAEEKVDDLEPHAERVRKYIQKYLKGEKAERPRLFMRLVLLALTKDNTKDLREQSMGLLEKLRAAPLPGDAFTEVEIVPYEHLWDLIWQLLEKRSAH